MSGYDTHLAETQDLTARLDPQAGWFGLVSSPAHPDAVPIILSHWFGLVDSLTWARHAVESKEQTGHTLNLILEEFPTGEHNSHDDEDWLTVAAPLFDKPTPHLIAIALVALQRLGVEVGREALAHGIDPDRPSAVGCPLKADPTVVELWGWVRDHWTSPPAPGDQDLRPDRPLHLHLHGEEGIAIVYSLVLHIARIVAAGRHTGGHLYVAMSPQLAGAGGGHQGGQRWHPAAHR